MYDDGGTHCFVCRRTTGGNPLNRFKKTAPKPPRVIAESKVLGQEAINWLAQYKLYSSESALFTWNCDKRWLIYKDGGFINARNFGEGTKYISYGQKPYRTLGLDVADNLCIVEDIVSAIKVGRQARVLPLFGSSIERGTLLTRYAESGCSCVSIFLDFDKLLDAAKLSYELSSIGIRTRVIRSRLDPKCLSDEEIKELLQ